MQKEGEEKKRKVILVWEVEAVKMVLRGMAVMLFQCWIVSNKNMKRVL